MKKSVIILLISLLFMVNLEKVVPYAEMFNKYHDVELVEQYDTFYKIHMKVNNDVDLEKTLKLLQHVLLENKLSSEIVKDDYLRDIIKNNFCNIYTSNANGYNNVIVDIKLDIEGNREIINSKEEKQRVDKLCCDIETTLKDNIFMFAIHNNFKLKLNSKFSMIEIRDIVEGYLKKNNYKADLVDIYNGYSIKVDENRYHNSNFQLSIIKYNNNNYILFGEPNIYISY